MGIFVLWFSLEKTLICFFAISLHCLHKLLFFSTTYHKSNYSLLYFRFFVTIIELLLCTRVRPINRQINQSITKTNQYQQDKLNLNSIIVAGEAFIFQLNMIRQSDISIGIQVLTTSKPLQEQGQPNDQQNCQYNNHSNQPWLNTFRSNF